MNGSGGQLHLFWTWALYGGKRSAWRSGRFSSREELRYPQEVQWAPNQTWIFWRIEIFLAATKILTSVRPACKVTISAHVSLWLTELVLSVTRLAAVWMTGVWFRTQWGRRRHASVAFRTSGSRGYSYIWGSGVDCSNFAAGVTVRGRTAWSEFAGAKIIGSVN
jgi:hypothetical protein